MPKIFLILALATCTVFGWMFYQYSVQQDELSQIKDYQTVLYEKAELIISKPKIGLNRSISMCRIIICRAIIR